MKMAVRYYPEDFCSWVLGEKVIKASFQDKEFARDPKKYFLDSLLEVTTATGQERLVHIEFQSAGNPTPMVVRMLMYFAMLTEYYGTVTIPIDIIVIYIGKGVGKNDTGDHVLGMPQIGNFTYRVIHLWQYDAADILASDHPTLLSLIGQSNFSNPLREVTAAFEKITALEDEKTRENLMHVLMMLLPDKDLLERIMKMAQDYAIDTPYMQMIREEKEAEFARGIQLGRNEGREEGLAKGLEEGRRQERELMTLEFLNQRFDLDSATITLLRGHFATLNMEKLVRVSSTLMMTKDEQEFKQLLKVL